MIWKIVFYGLALVVVAIVARFLRQIWVDATSIPDGRISQWRMSTVDSRTMYVDVVKSMITAAGIAVVLLASLSLNSQNTPPPLVRLFAKGAAVSLVLCICASLALMVCMSRFHEVASSRQIERRILSGETGPFANQGPFNDHELKVVLYLAGSSLSCFFLGFWFLLGIIWHY